MTPRPVARQTWLTCSTSPAWLASVRYGGMQQQAVGAGGLGGLGLGDRVGGAAGGRREDRHGAGDLRRRRRGRRGRSPRRSARSPRPCRPRRTARRPGTRRARRGACGRPPRRTARSSVEVGHREREQSALELGGQVGRAVLGHEASFSSSRMHRLRRRSPHARTLRRCLSKPEFVSGDASRASDESATRRPT